MTADDHAPPDRIQDTAHLEELLSAPTGEVVEALAKLDGDLLVLGAAGKMGPSLAWMARRAFDASGTSRRVIAVSRFSADGAEAWFAARGIETARCDLLAPAQIDGLPDAPNVVYMAGMKFGTAGQEARTWAMNAWLPGAVCLRFPHSRFVAFSTGNVYPLTPAVRGGSVETDAPAPIGEYAMSCLGRERVFEHFSAALGIPVVLLRLNYAVEMRYGVLADIARRVWAGEPVRLEMGALNAVWQGDACAMALQALSHAAVPPLALNVAGPELLSVRRVAEQFARLMNRPIVFEGEEASDALLSHGQEAYRLFGYPRVSIGQVIRWTADWVMRGGESLDRPTHFETRDGRF